MRKPGRRLRRLAGLRRTQKLRQQDNDEPLAQPEPKKRGLITIAEDHVADGDDSRGRAGAESRCGQAGGEAAPIGKPFERIADAGAINRARPDPGQRCGDV